MNIDKFYSRVQLSVFHDDCYLWLGSKVVDYGQVYLDKPRGKSLRAHRVAWEKEHGPIPDDLLVLHRCDTPLCVNVRHLFLGTQGDNMQDMLAKGRQIKAQPKQRGSAHSMSKLIEAQVIEIRARIASGERPSDLGREFKVSKSVIHHIKSGRKWRHCL